MAVRALRVVALGIALANLTLASAATVHADVPELVATLTGAQVVGPFPPPEPNGTGSVRIFVGSDTGVICFELRLSNMPDRANFGTNAFTAWIGKAAPGANGPTVATFPPFGELPVPETLTTGCISGLSPALVRDLFTSPAQFYVEVEQLNPDVFCDGVEIPCSYGAIRGQLAFAPTAPLPNTALAASTTATPANVPALVGMLLVLAGVAGSWRRGPSTTRCSTACSRCCAART